MFYYIYRQTNNVSIQRNNIELGECTVRFNDHVSHGTPLQISPTHFLQQYPLHLLPFNGHLNLDLNNFTFRNDARPETSFPFNENNFPRYENINTEVYENMDNSKFKIQIQNFIYFQYPTIICYKGTNV
jgi:hypothetical protein